MNYYRGAAYRMINVCLGIVIAAGACCIAKHRPLPAYWRLRTN